LDTGDFTGYASPFTEDAVWRGAHMSANGRAELLAMLRANFTEGAPSRDRHVLLPPEITVSGDAARSTMTFLVVQRQDDGRPVVRILGEYVDELVRTGEGWRYAKRVARLDMPPDGALPD
jgi:hypothetical protein